MKRIVCAVIAFTLSTYAIGDTQRSVKSLAAFKMSNPCPATGLSKGRCTGYQIDHIISLCAGGKDEPSNMQWLTIEAHRKKTKEDLKCCSLKHK